MSRYPGHMKVLGIVVASTFAVHLLSGVLEILGGGFSTPQLLIAFLAAMAIPFAVVGLCMAQRPHLKALGQGERSSTPMATLHRRPRFRRPGRLQRRSGPDLRQWMPLVRSRRVSSSNSSSRRTP